MRDGGQCGSSATNARNAVCRTDKKTGSGHGMDVVEFEN